MKVGMEELEQFMIGGKAQVGTSEEVTKPMDPGATGQGLEGIGYLGAGLGQRVLTPPPRAAESLVGKSFANLLDEYEEGGKTEEEVLAKAKDLMARKKAEEGVKAGMMEKGQEQGESLEQTKMRKLDDVWKEEHLTFENTNRKGPSTQNLYCLLNPTMSVPKEWIGRAMPLPGSKKLVLRRADIPGWGLKFSEGILDRAKALVPEMTKWWRSSQKPGTVMGHVLDSHNLKWGDSYNRPFMLQILAVAVAAMEDGSMRHDIHKIMNQRSEEDQVQEKEKEKAE